MATIFRYWIMNDPLEGMITRIVSESGEAGNIAD